MGSHPPKESRSSPAWISPHQLPSPENSLSRAYAAACDRPKPGPSRTADHRSNTDGRSSSTSSPAPDRAQGLGVSAACGSSDGLRVLGTTETGDCTSCTRTHHSPSSSSDGSSRTCLHKRVIAKDWPSLWYPPLPPLLLSSASYQVESLGVQVIWIPNKTLVRRSECSTVYI